MSSKRPSLPLAGGCSCGAIRYEISALPLTLYTCNCTNCQRASGSAFALNMPVATRDFRIVKGEPKGWRHVSPSGAKVTAWFCGECGARLHGEREGRPDSINVRAGTLDDTSWLVPVAHIYMQSAQPWVQPAPDAVCFETQPAPAEFREALAGWRSRFVQDR
ncbi:MAG: GFA family protein [Proteobacteria bacterium]|nr:GFA family protein [Pseudomonadota bacterium]